MKTKKHTSKYGKLKVGDIGPDGRIFRQYMKNSASGKVYEVWMNEEHFAAYQKKMKKYLRNYYQKHKAAYLTLKESKTPLSSRLLAGFKRFVASL
jgi:hypothetical protein